MPPALITHQDSAEARAAWQALVSDDAMTRLALAPRDGYQDKADRLVHALHRDVWR
ncbi:hypothetical protein [Streptomyces sp. NPDC059552]|uniref:hypothetical protein n=1 Tax=Streptomyces sp. NPDC059552 TaxID=3346862 RepID=UPI00368B94A1